MSRRVIPLLLAALLVASPAQAAPVPKTPKADDPLPPSTIRLLAHRQVQKELKMAAEQRLVVLDGLADIKEDSLKKIVELANQPNRPLEAFDKLDRDRQKAIEKLLTDAAKNLTDAQRKRLRQLDWRLRGVAAFTDPQVRKLLQLTDAQQDKAEKLTEQVTNELTRYAKGQIDGDETKGRDDLFSLRQDTVKKMEAALTAEQKTAWAAMLGAEPTGIKVNELWLRLAEDPPPEFDPEK